MEKGSAVSIIKSLDHLRNSIDDATEISFAYNCDFDMSFDSDTDDFLVITDEHDDEYTSSDEHLVLLGVGSKLEIY